MALWRAASPWLKALVFSSAQLSVNMSDLSHRLFHLMGIWLRQCTLFNGCYKKCEYYYQPMMPNKNSQLRSAPWITPCYLRRKLSKLREETKARLCNLPNTLSSQLPIIAVTMAIVTSEHEKEAIQTFNIHAFINLCFMTVENVFLNNLERIEKWRMIFTLLFPITLMMVCSHSFTFHVLLSLHSLTRRSGLRGVHSFPLEFSQLSVSSTQWELICLRRSLASSLQLRHYTTSAY